MKLRCSAKTIRLFCILAVSTLALAQLVPVNLSNPPVESEIVVPQEIGEILRRSCYDCHSNVTVWPWYSKIASVSWLLASDVEEGRDELNFSTWGAYSDKKKAKKLKEIWEEVLEDEMPPWYYVLMHRGAALSPADRELIHQWVAKSGG